MGEVISFTHSKVETNLDPGVVENFGHGDAFRDFDFKQARQQVLEGRSDERLGFVGVFLKKKRKKNPPTLHSGEM